jgi:hypothetical protein
MPFFVLEAVFVIMIVLGLAGLCPVQVMAGALGLVWIERRAYALLVRCWDAGWPLKWRAR